MFYGCCDGLPPTIYYRAAEILAPFIYPMATHVKVSIICWFYLWFRAHVIPIHKMFLEQTLKIHPFRSYLKYPFFKRYIYFNVSIQKLEHILNPLQHVFRLIHSIVARLIVSLDNCFRNFSQKCGASCSELRYCNCDYSSEIVEI